MQTVDQNREAQLLQQLWSYKPELPQALLSQAVGMQGDRGRLERFLGKLIRGGWGLLSELLGFCSCTHLQASPFACFVIFKVVMTAKSIYLLYRFASVSSDVTADVRPQMPHSTCHF
jgi:hypothetical protein